MPRGAGWIGPYHQNDTRAEVAKAAGVSHDTIDKVKFIMISNDPMGQLDQLTAESLADPLKIKEIVLPEQLTGKVCCHDTRANKESPTPIKTGSSEQVANGRAKISVEPSAIKTGITAQDGLTSDAGSQ